MTALVDPCCEQLERMEKERRPRRDVTTSDSATAAQNQWPNDTVTTPSLLQCEGALAREPPIDRLGHRRLGRLGPCIAGDDERIGEPARHHQERIDSVDSSGVVRSQPLRARACPRDYWSSRS